jgi:phosphatidylglycerophosphate synthase
MSKKERKQLGIKKDQSLNDYSFWMRVFRSNEVGSTIAGFILKHNLKITPNFVTLFGAFLNLISAIILILPIPFYYKPICVLFLWFATITDYTDGILARETNTGTKFGHWFDNIQVHFIHLFLPISVLLSIYVQTKNVNILYYLIGVLFISQLSRWTQYEMTRILLETEVKELKNNCSESSSIKVVEGKLKSKVNSSWILTKLYYIIRIFSSLSTTNWKGVLYMFCFIIPHFTYVWAILIPFAELINFIKSIILIYLKYSKISDNI